MVQVGAFSTRVAADAFSEKVAKAGYSISVVSGQTLHRVLVQAGPTKEEAVTLATRMNRSGFQGAFIVPPRQ
jgi:cell division protein FtsN